MGHRIADRRKEMHLTQSQLAELADVSPQMISYLENGDKAVRPENLIKISTALSISCDYILTGKTNNLDSNYLLSLTDDIDATTYAKLIEILNYFKRSNS